ncbi:unnamed protein product [Rotaria socialis]|nr:unnamed protein product [Rotaria socialis]CAF3366655.1 unnamed protein product [Rotaria socialis]CAF3427834.1 unnamed protein product [Rotaria socialis]CAF3773073.1 unnamed protein product [Rotaria socialis]
MVLVHVIIFLYAWRSAKRVAPAANTQETQAAYRMGLNGREKSLLKHMMFMLIVYVIGWVPLYIVKIFPVNTSTQSIKSMLAALPIASCWISITDMLVYHHEVRRFVWMHVSHWVKRDDL